jgi:hypothetical protein
MNNIITESGMNFIAKNTFHIEQSQLYKSIGEGVRSVEFVRSKDDKLFFVEAKTTFPNPENSEENFQIQISEICEKFIHSLSLYSSIKVGINTQLFDDFTPPEKVSLIFMLVIRDHKLQWCKHIRKELLSNLPTYLKKIWDPEIIVLNHEEAKNSKIASTIEEDNQCPSPT